MMGNVSEDLTLFPFTRGGGPQQFYDNGGNTFNDIIITPSPSVLPVFPTTTTNSGLGRTSLYPGAVGTDDSSNSNFDSIIDQSSLSYSSPATVFAVLVTFSICTIFGNSLVMLAVFREHYLKSPPNYFVASLAAADFSVGVLLVPFEAITQLLDRRWIFGEIWCDLWHSFDVLLTTASILNLCVISLDRYWAICTPLQYSRRMTPRRALRFIALVWICAFMISLPAIFWWRLVRVEPVPPDTCPFTDDVSYLVSSSCISFYIPLSVMLFAYYKIYLAAVKQSKSIQQGTKLFSSQDKNGIGDITLRMHRGGGNTGGANAGNNNSPHLTSHRKSFHFVGRSDPTGLTLLKRANTVNLRKGGYTTYFLRGSRKEKRSKSGSDSATLQFQEEGSGVITQNSREVIVPILLMSQDERTEDISGVISPPSNHVIGSSAEVIISSTASSPIMANVITTAVVGTNNASRERASIGDVVGNCNHNNNTRNSHHQQHYQPHHHHHLIPSMSLRRHSRRSFTVARKIAKFAKEKKAAKTLAIVLGVFIICWLPFFVINIVFALCKSCAEGQVVLFEVATWLGWINSAMNPVIYACWSHDFRRAFTRLLCCSRCIRARQRRKTQRRLSVV